MRLLTFAKRQISSFLAISLMVNGGFLPRTVTAEPNAPTSAEDVRPPEDLKEFSRFLWNWFLAPTPSHGGADTFHVDYEQTWNNKIYGYGYFVFGLAKLVDHPKFRELAKKGQGYRSQYWLDLVNEFLRSKENSRDRGFNLNPIPELLTSLRDFLSVSSGARLKPIDLTIAQNNVRQTIEKKYMSRTGETWRTWNANPSNRQFENRAVLRKLETEEVPGAMELDFEKWKQQQMARINEIIVQNYRSSLAILISDYEVPVGLHEVNDAVVNKWGERTKKGEIPPPKFMLSKPDLDRLKFRVEHLDFKIRIFASFVGSDKEFVVTVKSPKRGEYLGPYYYMQAEYNELGPEFPLGLFDMLYALKPIRHFKYDGNMLALGMQSDLADKLSEIYEAISRLTEARMKEMDSQLQAADEDYKKNYLDITPDHISKKSTLLGGNIAMDKWFDTDVLVDFLWYGYAHSDGFRYWRERDLQAMAGNKVALGQVPPRDLMPLRVKYRGIGFLKGIWELLVKTVQRANPFRPRAPKPEIAPFDMELILSQLAGAFQKSTEQLRKNLQVNAFRLDQPFPGEPVPKNFELPNIDDFKDEGVRVIDVNEKDAKPDLVLESNSGIYAVNGFAAIPRARTQKLVEIKVYDKHLRLLKLGKDFHVVEQPRTGALAIKILREGLGDIFKYTVSFRTAYKSEEPPEAKAPISQEILQELANALKADGHLRLMQALSTTARWAKANNAQISIRDLERLMKDNAYYTLEPTYVNRQGITCYNCAGASNLSKRLAAIVYKSVPGTRIEERACFERTQGDRLRKGDLHSTTLVTFPNGNYLYLDMTPVNQDPKAPLPADIAAAWESDEPASEATSMAATPIPSLTPARAKQLNWRTPLKKVGTYATVAGGTYLGVKVLFGTEPSVSPNFQIKNLIEIFRSIPITAYIALAAAVPTGFLAKHLWTKWRIWKIKNVERQEDARLTHTSGSIIIAEEETTTPDPESKIQIQVEEHPIDPALALALSSMRERMLELYKDMPKGLERKLEPGDFIFISTQLSNLMMSFLTGQKSYSAVRDELIRDFGGAPEASQGVRGLLDEFSRVAERSKAGVQKFAELLRTRQEARRGLHYLNPVLRRSVERIFDSVIDNADNLDISKITSMNCQYRLTTTGK